MPYELLHDPDKAQADRDKEYERITQENHARIKQLEMEEMAASIEPPKKEEVTPTPPGSGGMHICVVRLSMLHWPSERSKKPH